MMIMGLQGYGLGAFGDEDPCSGDTCSQNCPNDDNLDNCVSQCISNAENSSACQAKINALVSSGSSTSSSGGGGGGGGGGGTPWYQSVLTGITQGAAAGIFSSGVNCTLPQNAALPQCQTQPWYTTPFGIIMIVGLLGGGIYFLTKK